MRIVAVVLAVLVLVLGLAGCASAPPAELAPPLPEVVGQLWEQLGPPEIFPGVAAVLAWDLGSETLYVFIAYDPFRGWGVTGYTIASNSTVPSELEALMHLASRRQGDDDWREW